MNNNYFSLNEDDMNTSARHRKKIKESLEKSYKGLKSTLKNKSNLALIGGALGAHTAGCLLGYYDDIPQYDAITHLLSAFTLAKCSETFLDETGHNELKKYIPLSIFSAGVVWEIYEYLANVPYSLGDSDMEFLAALKNTIKDLGNDILGAAIAVKGSFLHEIPEKGAIALAKIDNIKYNIFGF